MGFQGNYISRGSFVLYLNWFYKVCKICLPRTYIFSNYFIQLRKQSSLGRTYYSIISSVGKTGRAKKTGSGSRICCSLINIPYVSWSIWIISYLLILVRALLLLILFNSLTIWYHVNLDYDKFQELVKKLFFTLGILIFNSIITNANCENLIIWAY